MRKQSLPKIYIFLTFSLEVLAGKGSLQSDVSIILTYFVTLLLFW